MQSHEVPKAPWTKVGIDLFEYNKQQYLLVVDYYSKFPYTCRLHSPNTSTVINKLKEIFTENGIPETVITDGRPQFRSEFKEFAKKWRFQHIQSSPHHHQSNGQAERFVQTVKETLNKVTQSRQDMELALLTYRATLLNAKIPSPAELLNSRRYKTLLPTCTLLQLKERERKELIDYKMQQETQYNRKAKDLPELQTNTEVLVQL